MEDLRPSTSGMLPVVGLSTHGGVRTVTGRGVALADCWPISSPGQQSATQSLQSQASRPARVPPTRALSAQSGSLSWSVGSFSSSPGTAPSSAAPGSRRSGVKSRGAVLPARTSSFSSLCFPGADPLDAEQLGSPTSKEQNLLEENRELRETLARVQSECVSLRKRNIAFVGGGFHAPHRECMCASLRMELSKAKSELQRLRSEARSAPPPPAELAPMFFLPPCALDAACQTDLEPEREVPSAASSDSVGVQACVETSESEASCAALITSESASCQTGEEMTQLNSCQESATQTTTVASRTHGCQASLPAPGQEAAAQTNSSSFASRCAAAVQTQAKLMISVAVEAKQVSCADAGVQAHDEEADRLAAAVAASEASVQKALAETETLRRMVHCNAWKHTNITILRPRAECVVNSERVLMDHWDPGRLSDEIETEVIPKFTRVFAEVSSLPPNKSEPLPRCKPADLAMQEFAEAFRRKLAEMLQPHESQSCTEGTGVNSSSNAMMQRTTSSAS
eukprot:CAMPEP_0178415424 /NCGR_PEP_ID=MMETSP0689_2-20121128/23543_1 /TAXON_ID=160604 /ORGANISM="Amphidinium massartii, Strain CS-259" /LENGTH=511 /DNA_ID=CAMNT_0020036741 /DNA_START=77 /DNA_END=1609 /DNA_ORIENTATION=-